MKIAEKIKRLTSFWKGIWAREIAAGLAFYFMVGIVPAGCALLFIIGKRLPEEVIERGRFFGYFYPFVKNLLENATAAASTGGIVVAVTSAYSSLNLVYRFRKCGEILYKFQRKENIIKRLLGFAAVAAIVVLISALTSAALLIADFFEGTANAIISYAIIAAFVFIFVVLLNLLVCPYKIGFKEVIKGSVLTYILWLIVTFGFTVYLGFADFTRLYGSFGCVFALMLYVYFIMQAFTLGVAYNILKLGRLKRIKMIKSDINRQDKS